MEKLLDLHSKSRIPGWGVVPGKGNVNINKWNKIEPGDVTWFARRGNIFASAVVTHKLHNKDLSVDLWGYDDNGQTWSTTRPTGNLL